MRHQPIPLLAIAEQQTMVSSDSRTYQNGPTYDMAKREGCAIISKKSDWNRILSFEK